MTGISAAEKTNRGPYPAVNRPELAAGRSHGIAPFVRGKKKADADGSGWEATQRSWFQPLSPPQKEQWGHMEPSGRYQPQVFASHGLSPAVRQMWQQQIPIRSLTEGGVGLVSMLNSNGVPAKLGGSLAARANGGVRNPGDVDIELWNATDFDNAYRMASNANTLVTMPDGVQAWLQGSPRSCYPGRMGQVDMALTYQTGERRNFTADLVNENAPNLDPHIYSPMHRQPIAGYQSFSESPARLTLNALSRHIFKPELSAAKGDVHQIAAMLRQYGINPLEELATGEVGSRLAADFQPPYKGLAQQKFREIIQWMVNGQI